MSVHPQSRIALILSALTLLSCDQNTDPAQPNDISDPTSASLEFAMASNSWTSRPPMPTPRSYLGLGVVKNSAGQPVVYAIGGYDEWSRPVTAIEAYNYSTNTWEPKAATVEITEFNGVGVIGGKLYFSGGLRETGDGPAPVRDMYSYDPVADVVTSKAFLPQALAAGVSGVIGGRLHVLSGICRGCPSFRYSKFYRYNPTPNTWTALPDPPNVHAFAAGGAINGKFYVAGGSDANGAPTAKLDMYDPATNKWQSLPPMPAPVSVGAGAILGNKLYVMGGPPDRREVYSYNPATNTWQTKSPLPTGRFGLAATSLVSLAGRAKLLAIGGEAGTETSGANEVYTP